MTDVAVAALTPAPVEESTVPAPADVTDPIVPSTLVADDAAERASDDGVLVSEADLKMEPVPSPDMSATVSEADSADITTIAGVTRELAAMGFTEPGLVETVLDKHGADLNACARDLAMATEWDALVDDLHEMGFANRALNKNLLLKHDGNVKRTVRELVEDA